MTKFQQLKIEDQAAQKALNAGKSPRDASIAGMAAFLATQMKGR